MAWHPSVGGQGRDGALGGYRKGPLGGVGGHRELQSAVTRCLAHTPPTLASACPQTP